MCHKKHGFTLVELLVVIAIIAILAAILFPVFVTIRKDSYKTTCLSNLKQIGLAMQMYSADYDDTIVPWLQPTNGPRDALRSDRNTWIDLLEPYVKYYDPARQDWPKGKDVQPNGIWKCPNFNITNLLLSINDPQCSGPGSVDISLYARQDYGDYSVTFPYPPGDNGSGTPADPTYNYPGSDPLYSGVTGTIAEIMRPAETVAASDGTTFLSNLDNWTIYEGDGCAAANAHDGGGNHLFFDGHVKFLLGNSEIKYQTFDSATGIWYKTYYTQNR